MPNRLANSRALLLLVGTPPTSRRRWDTGGMGTVESSRTFDVEAPTVTAESPRLFDVAGGVASESSRTFDVLGQLTVESARTFDVIALPASAPPIGIRPGPGPRAGLNLTAAMAPAGIDTTLAAPTVVGATTITVASAAGIAARRLICVDGEYRNVRSVSGTTVTLYVALGAAHAAGRPVTDVRRVRLPLLRDAAAGATTVTLERLTGLVPGMPLTIGAQTRTIADVEPGQGYGRVHLTSALSSPASAGTHALARPTFLQAISVHNKAGVQLGLITRFLIVGTRTHLINDPGNMDFHVPRSAPDVRLLHGDYLVAVGSSEIDDLWAGTMQLEQAIDGTLRVSCPDVFDLASGLSVKYEEELADNTSAASLYRKIATLMNEQRGAEGELEWAIDTAGSSKPYYGDIDFEGDPFDAWTLIRARSNTEFAWHAALVGAQLVITLRVRDSFTAAAGATLTDAPGSSNVEERVTVIRDPGAIINSIRLTGAATNVAKYLPEWARWAVHEFEPIAERSVAPGEYRRRKNLELRVDWTLSKSALRALAKKTEAQLWALYRTFVYAYHATYGRPYHEGWHYQGPPSSLEPLLYTGLGWRTRQAFIEYLGRAAGSVMISRSEGQLLVVLYDRIAGEQTVRRAWFSEAGGHSYLRMRVHGYTFIYTVEGGVITGRRYTPFDHSHAIVSKTPVTLMWPGEGPNSPHPETTYHTLRRVVSLSEDGAVTEQMWFDTSFVRGPTSGVYYDPPANTQPVFTKPTVGDPPHMKLVTEPAPDNVDLDASFVTRLYPFEERRIRDWDPRRDGVGAYINRRHVYNHAPSTRLRWHLVPWQVTGEYQGVLLTGINATSTTIYVDSIFGLPRPQDVPYILVLDEDPVKEKVRVTKMEGNKLTVVRGVDGTAKVDHEPGSTITYELPEGEEPWDGFVVHTEMPDGRQMLDGRPLWPEGEAWADEVLAHLQRPSVRLSIHVVNRNGTWATVRLGSEHPTAISTEGHPGGYTDPIRVLGYSIDETSGRMEIIAEEVV